MIMSLEKKWLHSRLRAISYIQNLYELGLTHTSFSPAIVEEDDGSLVIEFIKGRARIGLAFEADEGLDGWFSFSIRKTLFGDKMKSDSGDLDSESHHHIVSYLR